MKKIIFNLSIFGFIILFSAKAAAQQNEFRLGTFSIEINISGIRDSVENLKISLSHQFLFNQSDHPVYHFFTDNGNGKYSLSFPAETDRIIASLRIENPRIPMEYAIGTVELNQDSTLVLNCELSESMFIVRPSSMSGFNRYTFDVGLNPGTKASQKFYHALYGPYFKRITKPRKIYAARDSAWREVLRQLDEVLVPLVNDPDLTNGLEPRDSAIVRSNFAYFIYGTGYIPYTWVMQKYAPYGNMDQPPLEYYDFLNRIDYSHLTDYFIFTSPCFLLTRILLGFPGGIEPIGETPVREWQRQTAEKLRTVIHEVPDILPRMLSAASYAIQIDGDKKPLTPTQIKNISEGYDDDLGLIILNKNRQFTAESPDHAAE